MSFSKYFPSAMQGVSCTDIFHPGDSCWQATFNNFTKPLPTCAKFFTPIFCFQLLRKLLAGTYTADTLPELYDAFIMTTLTGYLGSASGQTCCCLMYKMLGKFYLPTCVLIPVCLGNVWGFVMPAKVNSYFSDYLSMMIFEAFYRCEDSFGWRLIKNSNICRTFLFMTMSAFIVNTQRVMKSEIIWFIQTYRKKAAPVKNRPALPSPVMDRLVPSPHQVCSHEGSCDAYIFQGVKSNLKLGLIIESIRFLLDNMHVLRKSPAHVLRMYSQVKWRVVSFFVGYTSIFRILNCMMNRSQQRNTQISNTVAAFVSGTVFSLYPDLTILSHATVSTIKLLWMRFINGGSLLPSLDDTSIRAQSIAFADKLPMSRLVYIFSIGYVFHLRLFYPWLCSSLLLKTTFYTSGFISDKVTMNTAKFLFGMPS